jgi:hypothetical protein
VAPTATGQSLRRDRERAVLPFERRETVDAAVTGIDVEYDKSR